MDKKYVKKISSEVYKKYPDMAGSKPKIITKKTDSIEIRRIGLITNPENTRPTDGGIKVLRESTI